MQLGLQLSFDSKQTDDIRSGVYLGEVITLDSKLHQGSDCTFSQSFSSHDSTVSSYLLQNGVSA